MLRSLSSILLSCLSFITLFACNPQTNNAALYSTPASILIKETTKATEPKEESPAELLARGIDSNERMLIEEALQKGALIHELHDRQLPISRAAYQGNIATLDFLLEKGAKLDGQNADKNTALMISIIQRNAALTQHLLDLGADITIPNFLKDTALHFAVQIGDVELCKTLLQKGADSDAKNRFEESPKSAAKRFAEKPEFANPSIIAIHVLLNAGSQTDNANALLWQGVVNDDSGLVQAALNANADINAAQANDLAILYAIRKDKSKVLSVLLSHSKLQIDAQNDMHETALMLAVAKGDTSLATQILDAGGNLHLEDRSKFTALHYAIDQGDLAMVTLLLQRGANPDHKNGRQPSPRSLAIRKAREQQASKPQHPDYNSPRAKAAREIRDLFAKIPTPVAP